MIHHSAQSDPRPWLILPIHDVGGVLFPWLQQVTPDLKALFGRAFVSLSPETPQKQPAAVARLADDPFFTLIDNAPGTLPGEHFLAGYRAAVGQAQPDQVLHLADIDRAAFALLTAYRPTFLADLAAANASINPLLFQRSEAAWSTYPENYRQVESMLVLTGRLLYQRYYDFAWSYLVIRAGALAEVIPAIRSRDFGLLVEMVLLLRDRLVTQDVDWLAWEDPFILNRDASALRDERSHSQAETYKRLRGVLPFFQHFLTLVPELNTPLKWNRPA